MRMLLALAATCVCLAQQQIPSYKDLKFPPLKEVAIPNVATFTLPNGMKLFLLEDHELPLVSGAARILVGTASDLEMDSAGRILLPAPLREQARLDKDIVLVGQGNKFEIWSAADWQSQIDGANEIPALLDAAARNGDVPDELKDFSL